MSGLEVLAIAASIIQIADVGVRVSTNLSTFLYRVRNVNDAVKSLSSDVALTSNVLRQLGENLRKDEQAKLVSTDALNTANEVLAECGKVFDQINKAMEQSDQKGMKENIRRAARKFGLALLERDLEALKGNLERLKSTLLLMLNVIMYAGQLRSQGESATVQDQQLLIHELIKEKEENEKRFAQLTDVLKVATMGNSFATIATTFGSTPTGNLSDQVKSLPDDLRSYYLLVHRLLEDIDRCQSGLGQKRYLRMRNGLVEVHSKELVRFEFDHGRRACQVFGDPFFECKVQAKELPIRNQDRIYTSPDAIVQGTTSSMAEPEHKGGIFSMRSGDKDSDHEDGYEGKEEAEEDNDERRRKLSAPSATSAQDHLSRKPLDDDLLHRISQMRCIELASHELMPPAVKPSSPHASQDSVDMSLVDSSEVHHDRESAEYRAHIEEHKRQVKQKDRAYQHPGHAMEDPLSREKHDVFVPNRLEMSIISNSGGISFRNAREAASAFGSGAIDFSPYADEKSSDNPVPQRKPPTAPLGDGASNKQRTTDSGSTTINSVKGLVLSWTTLKEQELPYNVFPH